MNIHDSFNSGPQLLKFQDSKRLTIAMNPIGKQSDQCDPVGRRAFKELVKLFKLQLYLDLKNGDGYPSDGLDPDNCLIHDVQNSNNIPPSSLPDALDEVSSYIFNPQQRLAARARADVNFIKEKTMQLPHLSPSLLVSIKNLESFLDMTASDGRLVKAEPGSAATLTAVRSLDQLRLAFGVGDSRHNGSGACRNPILHLQIK